jgi:hypothetical protein
MSTHSPGGRFSIAGPITASTSSTRRHGATLTLRAWQPAQARCTCASMNPGNTVASRRSMVRRAGTHDELVATGGRYATLWETWSATRARPRLAQLPTPPGSATPR